MQSPTAKNLKRITESVEQHDKSCEAKAKAVMLCPFELDRLGFDHVITKSGRRVPIKADDTLGTGRLRVVCDGYHGPGREEKVEDTVEAPAPAERELVPAGMPDAGEIKDLTGFEMTPWQKAFWDVAMDPEADLEAFARYAFSNYGRRKT